MKNHRFPWLRNRTTDNRKCEKARNIKEKRTIEMFNTVSKALVAHRSSQRDNRLRFFNQILQKPREINGFPWLFLYSDTITASLHSPKKGFCVRFAVF